MTRNPEPAPLPSPGGMSPPPRPSLLPLRPELVGEVPYGAPQLEVPVCLNVNENPYPPPPQVIDAMAAAVRDSARSLNRYPDREAWVLRTDLANYLNAELASSAGPAPGLPTPPTGAPGTGAPGPRRGGLSAEHIWAANGSNEVLTQVLQAFGGPGRTALGFAPTYSMYPEYARNTHTRWVSAPRTAQFAVDPDVARAAIAEHRPSVIFLTSPNNPTGTALPLPDLEIVCQAALAVQVPDTDAPAIVVVDEAYAEFRRPGTPSALTLLDQYPNLAVSRTMSKAFALAGARLGYLAARPQVVDALRVVRLPYHLSAVTQAVARSALAHSSLLLEQVGQLRVERDRTVQWLRAFRRHGGEELEVADSDANFVLFGRFADRHLVWQGLLDRGVLIRETGPDGWLRVSIGTPQEMSAFRRALEEVA